MKIKIINIMYHNMNNSMNNSMKTKAIATKRVIAIKVNIYFHKTTNKCDPHCNAKVYNILA